MRVSSRFLEPALRIAPAVLVSTIMHTILLIILALCLITPHDRDQPLILVVVRDEGLNEADLIIDTIETEPVSIEPFDLSLATQAMPLLPSGGLAAVSLSDGLKGRTGNGIGEGLDGEFGDRIHYARTHGLDIVVVFDSTGSMSAEIDEVKKRIHSIGTALLEKIPTTRISLATYRDRLRRSPRSNRRRRPREPEHYVVRGIPLTNQLSDLNQFLSGISAGEGGDRPEAVLDGLEWAIDYNHFYAKSLKVILIFGDAPPHSSDVERCLALAKRFHNQHKGTISTITCRRPHVLPEFYEIARAGGGEAHTLEHAHGLLNDLLVLTFGSEHREDVLEFFELE